VPGKGGVVTSPALANGHVYFTALDGELIKIDYSGRVVWTFAEATGSFLDFAVRGDEILFFGRSEKVAPPYRENSVRLFHLRDEGKSAKLLTSRWAQTYPTSGLVFAEKDRCGYQTWRAEEGSSVVEVWDENLKASVHSWSPSSDNPDGRAIPAYRDGRFYFTTRTRLFCLNARPPSRNKGILWQSSDRRSGLNSSPALSKEYLTIGNDQGSLDFYRLDFDPKRDSSKVVWSFPTSTAGKVNGGIVSSPAISDGRVYFGGEDGILYGLGKGEEAAVIEAVKPGEAHAWPGKQLKGPEWPTAGGDMGFSFVSPDTQLEPPFRVRWRTRVWGVRKGGVVVADGKVFVAGRSGQLDALDAETGEVIWRYVHPHTGSFCAPTYAEGKPLVLRGGLGSPGTKGQDGIWCHDASTGELLWHVPQPQPTAGYGAAAEGVPAHKGKALACWSDLVGGLHLAAYSLTDGKEVWSRHHKELLPAMAKPSVIVTQGAVGADKWFCSFNQMTTRAEKTKSGLTLALDPVNGDILWKNAEVYIDGRDRYYTGRVSYRNNLVVVFQQGIAGSALDAETGKFLWKGGNINCYAVPLSDAFLDSQGKTGTISGAYCGAHVFANGYWYGQAGFNSSLMVARTLAGKQETEVWSWLTQGRSCATAAPAYGRLYYCSNEGVVYCFENEKKSRP
jgi:outer membrane protein assembly factor BamB